jgi:DNA-binding MarR family transcriptional regulator
VHDTHIEDSLAAALLDLTGMLNSPRQDDILLRKAGVSLDRALFPLLARVGAAGSLGVVELAEQVGRDHSTISRQIARLESLGLVARRRGARDMRLREAVVTAEGRRVVQAITEARRRLLGLLLAGWSAEDRTALTRLNRRLADSMRQARQAE